MTWLMLMMRTVMKMRKILKNLMTPYALLPLSELLQHLLLLSAGVCVAGFDSNTRSVYSCMQYPYPVGLFSMTNVRPLNPQSHGNPNPRGLRYPNLDHCCYQRLAGVKNVTDGVEALPRAVLSFLQSSNYGWMLMVLYRQDGRYIQVGRVLSTEQGPVVDKVEEEGDLVQTPADQNFLTHQNFASRPRDHLMTHTFSEV